MSTRDSTDARVAELADAVIELAAKLDVRALRDITPLTGTEIAVMREVHRKPRISPSQVAEATGLHRSNVSAALRRLEARGLVVREHPVGDARAVQLVPTARASESVAAIHAYWSGRLRTAPDELLDEALPLSDVLRRLSAAL